MEAKPSSVAKAIFTAVEPTLVHESATEIQSQRDSGIEAEQRSTGLDRCHFTFTNKFC